MSEVIAHAPGTFCWVELGTSDQEAAKAFYADLFGWGAQDDPIGPDAVYTMLNRGEDVLGGLYTLTEDQKAQGVPPHWGLYVSTADVEATMEQVKALGGSVLVGPADISQAGRMAVCQDPDGAVFSVWQAVEHPGTGALDGPGGLVWSELASRDVATVEPFYTELFGWSTQTADIGGGPYTSFLRGETPAAGMVQITEEWGDVPPYWMPYFGVADCEAAVARAEALGATVKLPPTTIEEVGTFAVLCDPQGAVFSIIRMVHFDA